MINANIVFIGAGNMAEALVKGLVQGGVCAAKQITVTDPRAERLEASLGQNLAVLLHHRLDLVLVLLAHGAAVGVDRLGQ